MSLFFPTKILTAHFGTSTTFLSCVLGAGSTASGWRYFRESEVCWEPNIKEKKPKTSTQLELGETR